MVEGERLHGGWVLVRIKNRRPGDKKNNWLLIKHRDNFARDNDGGALLAEDRSVASGRAMAEIAAGKGHGPTPFILAAKHQAPPDAVWNSNKGGAAELRASGGRTREARAQGGAFQSSFEQTKASRFRPDARICRTRAVQASRSAALGSRMGARGQVRRLSHPGPGREWAAGTAYAQRAQLDGHVRCSRARGRQPARRNLRW